MLAISTNIFKRFVSYVLPEIVVLIRNFIGILFFFFVMPYVFEFKHDFALFLDYDIFINLLFFTLFTVICAQFLWYSALEYLLAIKVSLMSLLRPFFGVMLAVIILQERLYNYHFVGGVIVVAGLILTILHHQKHPKLKIIETLKHWTH